MLVDPTAISKPLLLLAGFGAAFVVVLWVSLIIWTLRDIRNRTRDNLTRILAVLVSAVLFLPGVLIYLILRPRQTLEHEYTRTLEEEALLQGIESNPLCPGCGRRIYPDWIACPTCYTRLKKACADCSRLLDLSWDLCPYCGTPTEPSEDLMEFSNPSSGNQPVPADRMPVIVGGASPASGTTRTNP